eukprot:3558183-Rhodomonas_salina.2
MHRAMALPGYPYPRVPAYLGPLVPPVPANAYVLRTLCTLLMLIFLRYTRYPTGTPWTRVDGYMFLDFARSGNTAN